MIIDSDRIAEVRRRIAEAASWCSGRARSANYGGWLRSDALAPRRSADGEVVVSLETVERVAAQRARWSSEPGREATAAELGAGRLLLFDREGSLSDGAAAAETDGFFDDDNVPPWDTWLIYVNEVPRAARDWSAFDSYLVCWVPGAWIELVQRGIDVNPESCLLWADQVDRPFAAVLGPMPIA